MNGAESLIHTLADSGVAVCFANPGTSEMHFVAALDRCAKIRPVLALFEGVATGMADGYGRMADKPAATLLHLGPGLANGIANLHNARRAATPIVNIVGDHARYHAQFDSPLSSDIVGLARPVSSWIHTVDSALTLASDAARAVAAARQAPGQIATLIVPADATWNEAQGPAARLPIVGPASVSDSTIDRIAAELISGRKSAILMRGQALKEPGLVAAGHIAAKTGARIMCDTFTPRLQRGAGRVCLERIPYRVEDQIAFFAGVERLILVGSSPPVASFAYPGKPSWCLSEGTRILYLSHPNEDGVTALEAVAHGVGATGNPVGVAAHLTPDAPRGDLNQFTLGLALARYLPAGAIISDESGSSKAGPAKATETALPHDHLSTTGGAIGQGLPVGTGAAIAEPGRKVVCLQADGSAMYTLQALWTQGREKLDVTTVILSNRSYAILQAELTRVGVRDPGPLALSMLDLGNPDLNWIHLAQGLGVEASRAETAEQFSAQFADAMSHHGPRLIEAVI